MVCSHNTILFCAIDGVRHDAMAAPPTLLIHRYGFTEGDVYAIVINSIAFTSLKRYLNSDDNIDYFFTTIDATFGIL